MGLEALVPVDERLRQPRRSFPVANFVPQFAVMEIFHCEHVLFSLSSLP